MGYSEIIDRLIACPSILSIALGGSRSRGQQDNSSDYDLFCVIEATSFPNFRRNFCAFLESIPCICYAAESFYLEDWGYLFKAIDNENVNYDISIIPDNRMDEISIRSTNVLIKDRGGRYQAFIDVADDSKYLNSVLESNHFMDYATLFGFEQGRFQDAIQAQDYWYAVRCLERLKSYLIRCDRIQRRTFPKSRNCPEKGYADINDRLKQIYLVDGSFTTLEETLRKLHKLFITVVHNNNACMRSQLICWRKKESDFS